MLQGILQHMFRTGWCQGNAKFGKHAKPLQPNLPITISCLILLRVRCSFYLPLERSSQEIYVYSMHIILDIHILSYLGIIYVFMSKRPFLSSFIFFPQGLEYCDERYSLDVTGGIFPLRGQTTNTRLLSCQTVEKFHNHVDREDSINEGLFCCLCLVILKERGLKSKQWMLFCTHCLKVLSIECTLGWHRVGQESWSAWG